MERRYDWVVGCSVHGGIRNCYLDLRLAGQEGGIVRTVRVTAELAREGDKIWLIVVLPNGKLGKTGFQCAMVDLNELLKTAGRFTKDVFETWAEQHLPASLCAETASDGIETLGQPIIMSADGLERRATILEEYQFFCAELEEGVNYRVGNDLFDWASSLSSVSGTEFPLPEGRTIRDWCKYARRHFEMIGDLETCREKCKDI